MPPEHSTLVSKPDARHDACQEGVTPLPAALP